MHYFDNKTIYSECVTAAECKHETCHRGRWGTVIYILQQATSGLLTELYLVPRKCWFCHVSAGISGCSIISMLA